MPPTKPEEHRAALAKAARRLRAAAEHNFKFIPEGPRKFIAGDARAAVTAIEDYLRDTGPPPLPSPNPSPHERPRSCP